MGGKGNRRREKNYLAAHGGSTRLPPPPDASSIDKLPSKLRQLISFSGASKKNFNGLKRNSGDDVEKRNHPGEGRDLTVTGAKREKNAQNLTAQHGEQDDSHEKKKKKRKRKGAEDLRFGTAEESGATGSKRKERKKQRLQERKKKHKKVKTEEVEHDEFRGHEEIKFGDVVEAPPKLTSIPKVSKTAQDASQERLRLQAVEAYRQRKGWVSRLGAQLPPFAATAPLL